MHFWSSNPNHQNSCMHAPATKPLTAEDVVMIMSWYTHRLRWHRSGTTSQQTLPTNNRTSTMRLRPSGPASFSHQLTHCQLQSIWISSNIGTAYYHLIIIYVGLFGLVLLYQEVLFLERRLWHNVSVELCWFMYHRHRYAMVSHRTSSSFLSFPGIHYASLEYYAVLTTIVCRLALS